MKKKLGKKESVSKQGRKNAKPGLTLDDSAFDNLDAKGMDYMDTEEAINEGRQNKETEELNVTHDTEVLEKGGSNEEQVNDAGNIVVSIVVPEVSTVNISTASRPEDDKAMLKGVAIKVVEESHRPARSVLTLKPLLKIDPKDKGKGVLEEQPKPAMKLKKSDLDAAQLAMDKDEFDEIQARMNADTLLAQRLQEAEREQFTVEQSAKFLHDTIAAQRKFLAEQREVAIRNKPLTKTLGLKQLLQNVFELVLGVDKTILIANAEDELWQNQKRWNLKSWDFYKNCGVHTLILEDGTKIHMLAERKYPLIKETLKRMMSLKLVAETASDGAYDLLRFIQKQIDDSGSYDGSEKDL
ncbi:hypothetical protein Tco_0714549 [Tanacetum coccineum]